MEEEAYTAPAMRCWILFYPLARRPVQGSHQVCAGLLWDINHTTDLREVGDDFVFEVVSFAKRRGNKLDPSVSFFVSRIDWLCEDIADVSDGLNVASGLDHGDHKC